MSSSKFKTMRHIETVRNHLDACCAILSERARSHDQSKLESPEVEIFEVYTPKLRGCTYGSEEYRQNMVEMKVAIDHHNQHNRHHPEHFRFGISEMNMFDLLEMLVDWKAAGMRHDTGDIYKSIEINQARFGYSDQMKELFIRTIEYLMEQGRVFHKANES